jgi:hypothetical protein
MPSHETRRAGEAWPPGRLSLRRPKPGTWSASADSLGELVFEVAPDSTVVTVVSFHFRQFQCGSTAANETWLHGDWFPDTDNTGTIADGQFTVGPQMSGPYVLTYGGLRPTFSFFDEITVRGKFDHTGTRANGTWRVAWAADDAEFSSGIVGLVIGFRGAGDRAVFEFDNFEVGAPPSTP